MKTVNYFGNLNKNAIQATKIDPWLEEAVHLMNTGEVIQVTLRPLQTEEFSNPPVHYQYAQVEATYFHNFF